MTWISFLIGVLFGASLMLIIIDQILNKHRKRMIV